MENNNETAVKLSYWWEQHQQEDELETQLEYEDEVNRLKERYQWTM